MKLTMPRRAEPPQASKGSAVHRWSPGGTAPQAPAAVDWKGAVDRASRFGHSLERMNAPKAAAADAPIQAKWILRNGARVWVPDDYTLQANETDAPPSIDTLPLDLQAMILDQVGPEERGAYASLGRRPLRAALLHAQHRQAHPHDPYPYSGGSETVSALHSTPADNARSIADRIDARRAGQEHPGTGGFDMGRRGLGGVIWTGRSDDRSHPVHVGSKFDDATHLDVAVDLPPRSRRHDQDYDQLTRAHAETVHHDLTHPYTNPATGRTRAATLPNMPQTAIPGIGTWLQQNRDYARNPPTNLGLGRRQRTDVARLAQYSEKGMWTEQGRRVAGSPSGTGKFTLRHSDPRQRPGTHLSREGDGEFFLTSDPLRLDVTTPPRAIRMGANLAQGRPRIAGMEADLLQNGVQPFLEGVRGRQKMPMWRELTQQRIDLLGKMRQEREREERPRGEQSSSSSPPREAEPWGGLAPGDPYSPWGRNHPLYWRHGWRRDGEGTA